MAYTFPNSISKNIARVTRQYARQGKVYTKAQRKRLANLVAAWNRRYNRKPHAERIITALNAKREILAQSN